MTKAYHAVLKLGVYLKTKWHLNLPQIVGAIAALAGSLIFGLIGLLWMYLSKYLALSFIACLFLIVLYWIPSYGYSTFGFGINPYKWKLKSLRSDPPKKDSVRFVCIADTHNHHKSIEVPDGDVLLHAGDFTIDGTMQEVKEFNNWMATLPHKHKIVIAGNHEYLFDEKMTFSEENLTESEARELGHQMLSNCTYLYDESITVEGIKIYGSPYQEFIPGGAPPMAFNRSRKELSEIWRKIPQDVDILLTHSPPHNALDRQVLGTHVGCPSLLSEIREKKPKYCVFGHVHEAYGVMVDKESDITYINAASCTLTYNPTHAVVVFDYDKNKHK